MSINWSDLEIEMASRIYEQEANSIGYSMPTKANKYTQEQCSSWNVSQRDELEALAKRAMARAAIFIDVAKPLYGAKPTAAPKAKQQQRNILRPKED